MALKAQKIKQTTDLDHKHPGYFPIISDMKTTLRMSGVFMGGLGMTEILLVGGIALLFFGPSRLPSLGQALGKTISNFKKGLHEANHNDQVARDLLEAEQASIKRQSEG